MQLHDPNLHQKLIEMCDCYLDTDYPAQLRQAAVDGDEPEAAALKYLALALLYALTEKAARLSFKRKEGEIAVVIKGEDGKKNLPVPTPALFNDLLTLTGGMLHSEEDQVRMPLALGLRSGEVELEVKLRKEAGREKLSFRLTNN